jgi:hypothetical protein
VSERNICNSTAWSNSVYKFSQWWAKYEVSGYL